MLLLENTRRDTLKFHQNITPTYVTFVSIRERSDKNIVSSVGVYFTFIEKPKILLRNLKPIMQKKP